MHGPGGFTGIPKYNATTAGTITVDAGGILQIVVVHASVANATLSIFGGVAIPVINGANPTIFQFFHSLYQANASSNAIVGVNTDLLYVHWIRPGHALA
jgi:hypothetical protein